MIDSCALDWRDGCTGRNSILRWLFTSVVIAVIKGIKQFSESCSYSLKFFGVQNEIDTGTIHPITSVPATHVDLK